MAIFFEIRMFCRDSSIFALFARFEATYAAEYASISWPEEWNGHRAFMRIQPQIRFFLILEYKIKYSLLFSIENLCIATFSLRDLKIDLYYIFVRLGDQSAQHSL
jgi:hypothetical protein